LPIIIVGLLMYAVGEFAAMYAVVHVSLWLVLVGLITCAVGTSGVALIAFPLFYLLTAIMDSFIKNCRAVSSCCHLRWASAVSSSSV
jgi:hypothetical protein